MSVLDFFKKKFYNQSLNKRDHRSTQRQSMNYAKAKHIAIVYDAKLASNIEQMVELYAQSFRKQGKKVSIYTFFNDNLLHETDLHTVFSLKDGNWFNVPKNPALIEFIDSPIDVLVCLNIENIPLLEYLLIASKANLKVGIHQERTESLYDLMLPLPKKGIKGFFSQLDILLKKINQ